MTPSDASKHIDAMIRRLPKELEKAEGKSLDTGKTAAGQLSAGPFTLGELRAMGHPYATSHPQPPDDPAVINLQTGEFREAWRTVKGSFIGGFLMNQLRNDDPKADWLDQGTAKMIRRPIKERIEERIQVVRVANILDAIRKATK